MKEKRTFQIIVILLITFLIGIPLKVNAQESVEVETTEEFEEAIKNEGTKVINVISDDIELVNPNSDTNYPGEVVDITGKTINLNNHTIKTDNMAVVFEGNNFVIQNGTFDAKGQNYSMFIGDEGTTNYATIENITGIGGFNIYNANNVVIKNCKVTGKKYYAIWCDEGGQAIIKSGTYETEGVAVVGLVNNANGSLLEIEGGTYHTNGKPLVLVAKDENGNDKWGLPKISGGNFDISVKEEFCKEGYESIEIGNNKYTVCNHASTSIRNQKEATETEEGYTGDIYCSNCGKEIKKGTMIPAKGTNVSETEGKIENIVDDKTSIKLEYKEGVVPENIKLEVSEITKDTISDKVKTTLSGIQKFKLFDINLLKDGVKIQPNGKVKISIPIPEDFDKSKIVVYRIEEEEKIEYEVTIVTIDNKSFAQFETNHFSYYVIGEKTKEEALVEHKLDHEPKTGTPESTIKVVLLLGITSIGYVICKKKIYK